MSRLSTRDESNARELAHLLGRVEEGAPPVLGTFVRELRTLLGTDRALAYAVTPTADRYELRFGHWAGFTRAPSELNSMMTASLATVHAPWALYNPGRPEGPQRNRVVVIPRPAALRAPAAGAYLTRLGLSACERDRYAARMSRLDQAFLRRVGMHDHHVCRVLVCEGHHVLAWVGASQPTAFGAREQSLLRRLVPALQRRLRTDRLLGEGPLALAALPALLEAISAAAFVLAANGAVQHSNAAGRALLDGEGSDTRDALAGALRGRRGDVELSAIAAPGMPHAFLAVIRRSRGDAAVQIEAARRRFRLTSRQVEVLERVLRGDGNKEIAADLVVSVRAIELHVTALLEKLRVNGRAGLAGRIFAAA